jgi:hypothetical protein
MTMDRSSLPARRASTKSKKIRKASDPFAIVRVKSPAGVSRQQTKNEWVGLLAALAASEQSSNEATPPDSRATERLAAARPHIWYQPGRYQKWYHIWKGRNRLYGDVNGTRAFGNLEKTIIRGLAWTPHCGLTTDRLALGSSPASHARAKALRPARMNSTWRRAGHQLQSAGR